MGEFCSAGECADVPPPGAGSSVIGAPEEKWMERPFACVVPKEGQTVSSAERKEFLTGKFAKF